ncbi:cyclic peptide export ABC transporter [Flavobacterium johnsoniae]|uniref:Cyclic peptide transporter n=1 Tax=Flavobacterium johnsoniae (strain ATCC 17061 / DSM 2064 / JCM 8514 / BCRC 14874 / CCUG 350202 / NBRC 14942 / NCIMB 11054 / UW101) TaxID=376686 RepID=A5FI44_FLAJ1|nr:cyclic peptide export ABC transporter [Flavobacterium johnsoniae]ABQ05131.1 cyclic peptide transporter [Flavobacterium johnsoniae UW101]OXG00297.1 cyclic peptide transporter [Flavobacterium johnsoniae UW101]WQG83066.1 cyclic peptide export ABC transporter [Flavobacterium johnsoniae UW101]SHL92676.1 putative ATP-binding cassette transporter [Flavobacterium johnsoniae]
MLKIKKREIFYLLLYAVPNTLLTFSIVYIINNVMAGNKAFLTDYMGIVFVSILVYTYLLNVIFQKKLNKFSFNMLYENEKKIFKQILSVPLLKLEQYGSQRFYTVVEDLRTFSLLPYTVTHTINSLLMLILCLIYMFTLSLVSALIVVSLIVMVGACYFIVMNAMSKRVNQLREYNDGYYKSVDDVIRGFKELKVSFLRRDNLLNKFIIPNRDEAMNLDFSINYVFLSINLISQYGLYFVVSVILFVLPALDLLSREDVISYVVIILFISGPINNIINLQQLYTRFFVANTRISNFIKDFEVIEETAPKNETLNDFQSLNFSDVEFTYPSKDEDSSFQLGPISLNIQKGETIFIVGGNGSGKSTFINLLTGLYKPTEGKIIIDDKSDRGENIQDLIAAVFTDNHLFSKNYDDYTLENNKDYVELLKTMEMDRIITDDKDSSIRRKFSKGQSKRMSLIFNLLEKKPVMVLDEWAADQDPHFRKYFYEFLLPKFKEEGKTIIAVTHDDAYFHLADRIIKFDYGNIVKEIKTTSKEELAENIWA